jgi:hypothetical protein
VKPVKSGKSICAALSPCAIIAALALVLAGCAETLTIHTPPPPIPYYEQPFCPGPGYLWIPGYWAYGSDDFYWVPGMWEMAPSAGLLWTPGYWGWTDGAYIWHSGYWGRHVGFYGGVNYGWGYSGVGYSGGYWREHDFYYNSEVTKVNVAVVSNTYQAPVEKRAAVSVVSYNGGNGGTASTPTNEELAAAREQHVGPTPVQRQHVRAAGMTPELRASANHGQPRTDLLAKKLVSAPAKAKVVKPKQKNKKKRPENKAEEKPHVVQEK